MRDAGHEAEREPAEHEQDRIRNPQHRREREQPRARAENRQQNQRVVRGEAHGRMLSARIVEWLFREIAHGIDILDDGRPELGEGQGLARRHGDVLWVDIAPGRAVHAHHLADGARRTFHPAWLPVESEVPARGARRGLARAPRARAGAAQQGRPVSALGTIAEAGGRTSATATSANDAKCVQLDRLLVQDDGLGQVAQGRG